MEGDWNGNGSISGTMTNAGKQIQFTLDATGDNTDSAKEKSAYTISSDVIIGGENEVYLRMHTFDINPPSQLLPPALLTRLLNQWWLIPSKSGSTTPDLAPDPSLLRMQASVIAVTKDHGLTTINGHSAYQYDVTIDPAKFSAYLDQIATTQGKTSASDKAAFAQMNATGTVWIDATTFNIHRIVWTITSTDPKKPFTLHIDASISNHNAPVVISIPADAAPFPGTSGSSIFQQTDASGSLLSPH